MNTIITSALVAVIASLGTYYFTSQGNGEISFAEKDESAYERVMRTGTLRCGYAYWKPAIYKNEATDKLEGMYPRLMKEISDLTGLNIEFTQEVAWANVVTALESGKIDAMCAGMWQSATKAKGMHFSTPITYQGVEAFIRGNETRFSDIYEFNREDITIAVIDNDNSAFIADVQFPNAKRYSLPVGSSDTELLLAVQTGKADVTFTNAGVAYGYMQANKSEIKRFDKNEVLRIFGNTLVTKKDEYALAHMMDIAIEELMNAGVIRTITDTANQLAPETFMYVSKPYEIQ